jgi:hypothetical protein
MLQFSLISKYKLLDERKLPTMLYWIIDAH